ncbi:nose resistant to fluoxetine protein 6-like, partial [Hyposmocoma kahamanoa]|uniref:nose resistant to fluoxetine protein 6-like n=1 Tax=Hyposmocoma kahamanoa TaxID=1477025 RepID=UPI000E6D6DFC
LEAGPRVPRGILQGNFIDQGNYRQCLGINRKIDDMVIDGKYCQISIGLASLVKLGGTDELKNIYEAGDTLLHEIKLYERIRKNFEALNGISSETTSGMFSLLGVLAICGTIYDIWNTLIRKRDPKALNKINLAFSVHRNCRRLITYKPVRGALECVDGIRAITMAWVVIGHTFATAPHIVNMLDVLRWGLSSSSIWVIAAPIAVDTFFLLSGLLIVYTTVGKLSNMKLLKKLHLFYLNRILRMFPLLASTILLQVGVFHYIHDGPNWHEVGERTRECRINWWSTLLYVQNYVPPICLPHTWYLAIDMQLYILSPLILFWVLSGKKNRAWSALIAGLLVCLTASTIYNFLNKFTATMFRPALSMEEGQRYWRNYYLNTLTRCSPFVVGMCFGYLIHYWRENNIRLSK